MTYKVVLDAIADAEIQEFGRYAADYSGPRAIHSTKSHLQRRPRGISQHMERFLHNRTTNRGYLFRVGRRTSYWIVYTVDEDAKIVKVLRFWNASKEPAAFEL
jgi:hypothetical protein